LVWLSEALWIAIGYSRRNRTYKKKNKLAKSGFRKSPKGNTKNFILNKGQ
jgi:hypothetical protein